MIYLDYAATSFPKAPGVGAAMKKFIENYAGNPGRSGHALSVEAGKVMFNARDLLCEFFNIPNPEKTFLTYNATYAMNTCFNALLKPGDEVVVSSMEHNAVMRPLRRLEQKGLKVKVAHNNPDGTTNLDNFRSAITENTRLVVTNHASNIVGIIQPIREIAELAHSKGALFLLDSAQTAGILPIDMQKDRIDLLVFTGHKGLHGPTGTGGLLINETVNIDDLEPFILGGTGSRSEDELQPIYMPDKLESGTQNTVGYAGLVHAIEYINERGLQEIYEHEYVLAKKFIEGLSVIPKVTIYGNPDPKLRTAVVSINIEGIVCSEVGDRLAEEFDIMSRIGMHCAPTAHKTVGSFPHGTVRLAPGLFSTVKDIDETLEAIRKIST